MIIKYANILGRSPSALNMKVGNIGRLDPDLKEQGITRLIHGAKMEEEVWNEFYGNPEYLAYESERLIAEFAKQSIEQSSNIEVEDLPQGVEHEMIVRHASTINPTASTAKEEQRDEDVITMATAPSGSHCSFRVERRVILLGHSDKHHSMLF